MSLNATALSTRLSPSRPSPRSAGVNPTFTLIACFGVGSAIGSADRWREMQMTVTELSNIARAGGTVSVDGAIYGATELTTIARAGQGAGGGVIVRNASRLTAVEAASIARAGPGHVTLEY